MVTSLIENENLAIHVKIMICHRKLTKGFFHQLVRHRKLTKVFKN
jgi:hypothetical protein